MRYTFNGARSWRRPCHFYNCTRAIFAIGVIGTSCLSAPVGWHGLLGRLESYFDSALLDGDRFDVALEQLIVAQIWSVLLVARELGAELIDIHSTLRR